MGKKIIFTQEQIDNIKERYLKGESAASIGRLYNVSSQTIRRLLDKESIVSRKNRRIFFNENIFEDIDTAEKAYWIGFITADGYVNEDRGVLSIKLGGKDRNHLEKFIKFINGESKMIKTRYHNLTGNELVEAVVNSRKLTNDLVKLNIRQAKSSREQVAPIPEEFIKDYIRGLFDGDGHIEEKSIDLVNSVEVLKFVQTHLHETCDITLNKIINHFNTHRFYICKNRHKTLEYLYYDNCIALERKYNIVKNILELKKEKEFLKLQYKKKLRKLVPSKVEIS